MKFKTSTGGELHIILLSGHSIVIGPDFGEVPDIFVNEALARGCIADRSIAEPNKTVVKAGAGAQGQEDQQQAYRKAFITMLERNEEGDFTNDNLPNTNAVSKLAGFRANKEEMLAEFRQMQIEAADAKPAGSDGEGADTKPPIE